MKKSLGEWLNYIGTIHQTSRHQSLDRLQPLVKKLNITQFNCPVITVGGTNGKGSTVCALQQIYLQAGYRVAAYTSPHLIDFRERLKINNELLAEETWCEAFEKIEALREQLNLKLSFFEYATFAAFLMCQQHKLDVIILEVGLGGRLDAVNLIENDCAIITSVDLDHIDWLGDTREKIACEKAGIIRKIGICGDPEPPIILEKIAEEKNAAFYQIGRDFNYPLPKTAIPETNLACALKAVEIMQPRLPVKAQDIAAALPKIRLPGRFQTLAKQPLIIVDVAHNPQAARYLREKIMSLQPKTQLRFVFAALKDKLVIEMTAIFRDLPISWYLGDLSELPRGLSARQAFELLATAGLHSCYTFDSVEAALAAAVAQSEPEDSIVVWGSFHTVAVATQWIAKRN